MRHHARRVLLILMAACALLLVFAAPSMARTHRDRNHDGLPDRWERSHHLSLKVNQARRDQDRDGMRNRAEFVAGTNPRDADTDNDGVKDGREDAGTVVSFDATTGTLVIKLFNGDQVTGTVTADTEIECGDRQEQDENDNSGRGRAASRDHGGGGDDQGDDDRGDAACDASSLTPGMVVREAELSATPEGLVFDKIEVVPTAPTQPVPENDDD
jgi:thrombospondin type 3 repeat protein